MKPQMAAAAKTLWIINAVIAGVLVIAATFCFSILFPRFALYERTGAWVAEAVPPIVQYNGRAYEKCEKTTALTSDELAYPIRGRTEGGGTILAPSGPDTPVLILVKSRDNFFQCSLIGGP